MSGDNYIKNIDWITVLLYIILGSIGVAFIYSTTNNPEYGSFFQFNTSYGKQSIWFGLSVLISIIILLLDGKFYTTFAYFIYTFIILLLIGVLLFGVEIKGSKSWFKIGSVAFQPAELAKFATALALSKYLSIYKIDLTKWKDSVVSVLIVILPIFLIFLQHDIGSMLVFTTFIFVLHREGLSSWFLIIGFSLVFFSLIALLNNPYILLAVYAIVLSLFVFYNKKDKYPINRILGMIAGVGVIWFLYVKYLIPFLSQENVNDYLPLALLFLVILIAGVFVKRKIKSWLNVTFLGFIGICIFTFSVDFLFNEVLKEHHRNRINIILGKIHDPANVGYNLEQSKIAIGSGGFSGKGYLQGTQTMLNYVPEQSTDFIFTSIAEEFGFIGSFVLIGLYVIFLLRILFLAERQRSIFSRVYGYGVVSILFFHFAINIAMTIGLAPVIGIPLPFLSYGGSSLLSFTILLFVFLRLDTQRMLVLK